MLTFVFLAIFFILFINETAAQSQSTAELEIITDIRPDFNGDGYADLAVGASGERFGDANAAGAMTILYGDPEQTPRNSTFLHQSMPYIPDSDEYRDYFGARSSYGDFNGDGLVDFGECIGKGNTNVMFWMAHIDNVLSDDQKFVIHRNPTLYE